MCVHEPKTGEIWTSDKNRDPLGTQMFKKALKQGPTWLLLLSPTSLIHQRIAGGHNGLPGVVGQLHIQPGQVEIVTQ